MKLKHNNTNQKESYPFFQNIKTNNNKIKKLYKHQIQNLKFRCQNYL